MDEKCAACRRAMCDPDARRSWVGVSVQLTVNGDNDNEEAASFRRIYPELQCPLAVSVCWVCWLKSMGVPIPLPDAS